MQQSPTISIEQELLSLTISRNSSEISLNKLRDKWYRIIKRIIQFFRFIKIPILRLRFIDMISQILIDHYEFEELNNYETNKIQEDLRFLDDIKRYHEVFNTFILFGFNWQNKEFQLVKLKANYIYDHYMSIPEAVAKTNIPIDTIPIIYNRINSSKIYSSLIYFNLFNDAEKFIIEKLLRIYIHEGLNCFTPVVPQKRSVPIKENQIINKSIENIKHKDIPNIEPQYDELIIPNWTYSTDLGFIYNPIREKRTKRIKKLIPQKTKNSESTIKHNHTSPNEKTQQQVNFTSTNKPLLSSSQISHNFPSLYYNRCDTIFNKKQLSKKIFICKVHSSSWPHSYSSIFKNELPYRMGVKKHS